MARCPSWPQPYLILNQWVFCGFFGVGVYFVWPKHLAIFSSESVVHTLYIRTTILVSTSLRFSVNFTGWLRQRSGLTLNSQYSCSTVYTGLCLHTSPMNLVVQLNPYSAMQTSLGIVIYTGRSSNSPYDRGWSVISGRCVTCMEQSSTARHHVTFPSSL